MKEIILTQGKVALVDDEDFDRVNQFNWCAIKTTSGRVRFYASRSSPRDCNGKQKFILLHRVILGVDGAPGNCIDHVSGDGLDNRRSNLRFASQSQNNANRFKQASPAASRYKGVFWRTARACWIAHIRVSKYGQYLGRYESEEAAAIAYDYAAKIYFGEFARLNFPE